MQGGETTALARLAEKLQNKVSSPITLLLLQGVLDIIICQHTSSPAPSTTHVKQSPDLAPVCTHVSLDTGYRI